MASGAGGHEVGALRDRVGGLVEAAMNKKTQCGYSDP